MDLVEGLRLFYDDDEQTAGGLIAGAISKSRKIIQERWGLQTPRDCRVYVMKSWPKFLFHSAPWAWKTILALTLPFYALRFHIIWPYAGGWTIALGKRTVVGIKPPELLIKSNLHPTEQLFYPYHDIEEKVEAITCHELVHAFSAHLKLPSWLNEGLATLTVDACLGRQIMRKETIAELDESSPWYVPHWSGQVSIENMKALLFQYVCGYWQTRYIDETRPGLLQQILAKRRKRKELENEIAAGYGKEPALFWKEINREVRNRFMEKPQPSFSE